MRTLTSLLLFITLTAAAQQPPVVNCITNITINITNVNSYMNSDTNLKSLSYSGADVSVVIYDSLCPTNDITIGYVGCLCDSSVNCGGNEGQPAPCPAGNSYPIVMPAGVWQTVFRFHSTLGCCSLKADDHFNDQHCTFGQDPGCGGYQP